VRVSAAGTVAWYLTDYQNSVVAMTDGAGAVQDKITYNGFGAIATETNAAFGDRYKYTGREYQAVLGLQYNRDRWYNPSTGTWKEDPIRWDAGDADFYRYADNNAPNGSDPSGDDAFKTTSDFFAGWSDKLTFGGPRQEKVPGAILPYL
jgi:RHS repeat-associated protein